MTEAVAQICRKHLLTEKWLLAPSLRLGNQWLEAMARTGQPAVNLQVKTLKSLAHELAAPELARENLSRLAGRGGALVVDAILGRLRAERLPYLSQLLPSIRLSEAVYHSIVDLRLAGLDATHLDGSCFEVGTKGGDLARVLSAYLDHLQTNKLVDYAQILRIARRRVKEDQSFLGNGLVLIPEDVEHHALERELLDALPPGRLVRLSVDKPVGGGSAPAALGTDLELLRWLPEPALAPPPCGDGTVQFFRAMGEVNEVREVVRRCLADHIPFDDVEILHTDGAAYVPLIYEVLQSSPSSDCSPNDAPPVTFVEGFPCRYSRPGRALSAWVAWVRGGCAQPTLVEMVREGLLAIPDQSDPNFSGLAALLRSLGVGSGRGRYLPRIDRQIDALKRQIEKLAAATDEDGDSLTTLLEPRQRKLRDSHVLRGLISGLLQLTPEPDASRTHVLDAAVEFLDNVARRVSKIDNYARERLVLDIKDVQHWLKQSAELVSFNVWDWLAALPDEAPILGSGPREGCLHVAPASSGGHTGRRHTFIIGLDDGRFPGGGIQDPLLLDNERKNLSKELTTSATRLEEKLRGFSRLLARLRGSLTLSYSCRDLREDRDKFPSPVVLAAYRVLSGNHESDQTDFLTSWLPRAIAFAPEEARHCLGETEWWLWRLCGPQAVADAPALVAQRFRHIERGWAAQKQRDSDAFTVFDGLVEQAGVDLDPTAADGPVLSSRKLETVGRCPLAYFFRHVLKLEEPEELRIDRSIWLDSLTSGRLTHAVFERFLRELIESDRLPVFERDLPRLQQILDELVSIYQDDYPPPSKSVFQEQYQQLQKTMQVFLKVEHEFCASQNCRPVYVEAGIGMKAELAGTVLAPEALEVRLPSGKRIRVAGKLDRIDRIGDGAVQTFAIWDYKSGSSRYRRDNPFRQGRVIQPYLYVTIIGHLLQSTISCFGFFFPGMRDRGLRIQWAPEQLAEGGGILESLCQIIRGGAFLATNNAKEDCAFCEYRAICGDVEAVAAASQKKLENPSNTLLQPFLGLRTNGEAQEDDTDE